MGCSCGAGVDGDGTLGLSSTHCHQGGSVSTESVSPKRQLSIPEKLAKLEGLFNGDIVVAAEDQGTFVLEVLDFDDTVSFYTVSVDDDGTFHDLRTLSWAHELPFGQCAAWVPLGVSGKLEWANIGETWESVRD